MMRGIDFVTTNNPDLATKCKEEIEQTTSVLENENWFNSDSEKEKTFKYCDMKGYKIELPIKGQLILRVDKAGTSDKIFY